MIQVSGVSYKNKLCVFVRYVIDAGQVVRLGPNEAKLSVITSTPEQRKRMFVILRFNRKQPSFIRNIFHTCTCNAFRSPR
jgi:hypothetical protein